MANSAADRASPGRWKRRSLRHRFSFLALLLALLLQYASLNVGLSSGRYCTSLCGAAIVLTTELDARRLAELDGDALVWPELANQGDDALVW